MTAITVPNSTPYTQITATSGQSVFSFSFPLQDATDLSVYLTPTGDNPDQSTQLLVLNTDYTLSSVPAESGTIALTATSYPSGATANDVITIARNAPQARTSNFGSSDITADDLNNAFNNNVIFAQQNENSADRSVHFDKTFPIPGTLNRITDWPDGYFLKRSGNAIVAVPISTTPAASVLETELAVKILPSTGATKIGVNIDGIQYDLQTYLENQDMPFSDDLVIFKNISDATKKAKVDLSELATDTEIVIKVGSGVCPYNSLHQPGDTLDTFRTSANDGWLVMTNGTIGNASSNATVRANADTQSLYEVLWAYPSDQCPLFTSSGVFQARGLSAAADYAANLQLALPPINGRSIVYAGSPAWSAPVIATNATNLFTTSSYYTTITDNLLLGTKIQFSATGALPTGISGSTDYYVIPQSSTTFKVASSLSNAASGTAVTFSDDGSGVTYTTQPTISWNKGQFGGEQEHFQKGNEVGVHSHTITDYPKSNTNGNPGGSTTWYWEVTSGNTNNNTINAPMPIMNPVTCMYKHIKL